MLYMYHQLVKCAYKQEMSHSYICHREEGSTNTKSKKDGKDQEKYNQVPHLTQDTTWESNKATMKITNKSQEVSPFPAGDHKAAMNRRESMRNTRHKKLTIDPQKKYPLGTVCKIFYC